MHASDVVSHNAGGIAADAARIVVCRWADCADDVFLGLKCRCGVAVCEKLYYLLRHRKKIIVRLFYNQRIINKRNLFYMQDLSALNGKTIAELREIGKVLA